VDNSRSRLCNRGRIFLIYSAKPIFALAEKNNERPLVAGRDQSCAHLRTHTKSKKSIDFSRSCNDFDSAPEQDFAETSQPLNL
jgi:hypothetical protein